MHLIDTHCHLLKRYYKDKKISDIVDDALKSGVKRMINISTDKESILEVIESTKENKEVFCAIGFHPQDVSANSINQISIIEDNTKLAKVVAIGEIGFDFYREDNIELRRMQTEMFHKQLRIAEEAKLPVIIHSRKATSETIEVLKQYPRIKKVVHCFSENIETMERYLNIPNTFISFTGIVTFKNAKDLHVAFENCPDDKYMLETDCPYLAPTPYRGKTNEPKYVKEIAESCARLKNLTFNQIVEDSSNNAYDFFKKLY